MKIFNSLTRSIEWLLLASGILACSACHKTMVLSHNSEWIRVAAGETKLIGREKDIEIELLDLDLSSKRCFFRIRTPECPGTVSQWLREGHYFAANGLAIEQLRLHSIETNLAIIQLKTVTISPRRRIEFP